MNYKTIISFFASTLIDGICIAQTNQPAVVEDFKTTSTTQSGKQYPQVLMPQSPLAEKIMSSGVAVKAI